jgi:hypothetical protein
MDAVGSRSDSGHGQRQVMANTYLRSTSEYPSSPCILRDPLRNPVDTAIPAFTVWGGGRIVSA